MGRALMLVGGNSLARTIAAVGGVLILVSLYRDPADRDFLFKVDWVLVVLAFLVMLVDLFN